MKKTKSMSMEKEAYKQKQEELQKYENSTTEKQEGVIKESRNDGTESRQEKEKLTKDTERQESIDTQKIEAVRDKLNEEKKDAWENFPSSVYNEEGKIENEILAEKMAKIINNGFEDEDHLSGDFFKLALLSPFITEKMYDRKLRKIREKQAEEISKKIENLYQELKDCKFKVDDRGHFSVKGSIGGHDVEFAKKFFDMFGDGDSIFISCWGKIDDLELSQQDAEKIYEKYEPVFNLINNRSELKKKQVESEEYFDASRRAGDILNKK